LYELDNAHLNKFEAEISSSLTFLDIIEVIKKMLDVLFTHINTLTRDLYECSHYDQSTNQQNTLQAVERLEREVKIQVRLNREQQLQMVSVDKEMNGVRDELVHARDQIRVDYSLSNRNSRKRTLIWLINSRSFRGKQALLVRDLRLL